MLKLHVSKGCAGLPAILMKVLNLDTKKIVSKVKKMVATSAATTTVAAALAIAALPLSASVPDQVARVRHSPLNSEASVQSLVSTMSDNALTLTDIHRLLTIKDELPRLLESKGAYVCVKDKETCYCYRMSLNNNKVNFEAVFPTESLPKGATLVFA